MLQLSFLGIQKKNHQKQLVRYANVPIAHLTVMLVIPSYLRSGPGLMEHHALFLQ